MSREEELIRLVELYSRRDKPASGVVSRSRLKSWLTEQTDLDGMWEPFLEKLIADGLWAPWDGTDLHGTREQRPSTYRDAGKDARVFSSPRPPPYGYVVAAFGLLGFLFFMLTSPPDVGTPAYGAFFSIVVMVSGLYQQVKHGRPELSVRLDGGLLHLKRERRTRTLPLKEIDWVDVEWQGIRFVPPGTGHYEQNRFGVVATLHSGERVVLLEHVVREVALKVCRAIETSVEAPRPRIRIEATVIDELEADAIHEELAAAPRADDRTEPTVIVDDTIYEGAE